MKRFSSKVKAPMDLQEYMQSSRSLGCKVSENTVAKYMRELGLDARLKKKFRVVTTDSKHQDPIAPRLFETENHEAHQKAAWRESLRETSRI